MKSTNALKRTIEDSVNGIFLNIRNLAIYPCKDSAHLLGKLIVCSFQ